MALRCGHVPLAPVGAGLHTFPALSAGGAGGAAVLLVAATHGLRDTRGKQWVSTWLCRWLVVVVAALQRPPQGPRTHIFDQNINVARRVPLIQDTMGLDHWSQIHRICRFSACYNMYIILEKYILLISYLHFIPRVIQLFFMFCVCVYIDVCTPAINSLDSASELNV